MKKLMVMMTAAVVGACAWAADFSTSVWSDIAGKTKGDTNIVGYDSAGKKVSESGSDVHWWADNWKAEDYDQPAAVSNDTAATTGEGNYLAVETEPGFPLLRTFSKMKETGDKTGIYEADPVAIADHGLFVDMKLKFTGTDTAPTIDDSNTSKLRVWLKTVETEGTEGDADYVAGVTNLMVTCGVWVNNVIVPTNYVLNAAVDPAKFYQLTIRTDKNTVDNIAQFKIYLDGAQVKTVDDLAVFPALVSGAATLTLAKAGFEGTGFINSVDLLTAADAPAFAKDPTYLTLAWDANVASITIGGENVIAGKTSPYALPITTFGTDIAATIAYATGYRKDSITPTGLVDFAETTDGVTFKVTEFTTPSLTVASVIDRNEATITVNGEKVTTAGTLLEGILKYVNGLGENDAAVITLTENASLSGLNYLFDFDGELVLDLAGCTITGASTAAKVGDYLFMPGCVMTIKDTVGNGAIIAPAGAGLAFFGSDATLEKATVGEITFEGAVNNDVIEDEEKPGQYIIGSKVTINGGQFTVKPQSLVAGHEGDGIIIPQGKKWENDGTYWTLVDDTPAAGGFKVIIAGTATYFEKLSEAVEAESDDGVITVVYNTGDDSLVTISKAVTLDLNGKTLTQLILVDGGNVTVKNGTLTSAKVVTMRADSIGAITLADGAKIVNTHATGIAIDAYNDCTVTVGADCEVSANHCGIFVWNDGAVSGNKTTLTVNGTVKSGDGFAICGSGNDTQGTDIMIGATASVESEGNIGLYFPNAGALNITGGTIKGTTAVYVKSGNATISGATLIATGDAAAFVHDGNGAQATGDALVVESCDYPAGAPIIAINGGTFESANSYAVGSYAMEGYTALAGFVAGGAFKGGLGNANDAAVLAADFAFGPADAQGYATVATAIASVDGVKYTTLAQAVAIGGNVTLLADTTENITIAADKTVVLDLNGKTLTGATSACVINNKGTLTLGGGTVGSAVASQNTLIRNGNNATMTINDGTYQSQRIVIKNDEDGIGTGGNLTINGGTFTTVTGDAYNWDVLLNWGTATINGGTFNGLIESAAYGTWNAGDTTITGGTFNSKVLTITYFNGQTAPQDTASVTVSGGTFADKVYRNIGPYAGNPNPADYYDVDTATSLPEPYASAENKGEMELDGTAKFAVKPADAVVAAGKQLVKVGDYWTIAAPPVAKIGDKEYASLEDAFAAAKENDTITLLNNIGLTKSLYIKDFKGTLDLNGYELTNDQSFTASVGWLMEVVASDLTVANGTIKIKDGLMIYVLSDAKMTVAANATIAAIGDVANTFRLYGCTTRSTSTGVVTGTATLNVYGTMTRVAGTQGSDDWEMGVIDQCVGDTVVNVYEGAVLSHASGRLFKMSGGTPTVNVYGGTLTAGGNGEMFHAYSGSGNTVKVTGGTFNMGKLFSGSGAGKTINVSGLGEGCTAKFSTTNSGVESLGYFCDAGYAPVKGSDGYYTIGKPVAMIGNDGFATVADAVAVLKNDDTIKLVANSTNTAAALDIVGKTGITLDLNGFELASDVGDASYGMNVKTGSSLTITDTSADGNGRLLKLGNATFITIDATSSVTMENGSVVIDTMAKSNGSKGACFKNEGTLTVNGGTLNSELTATSDFVISPRTGSTTTINGGTFLGKIQTSYPGVVSIPAFVKGELNAAKFKYDYSKYVTAESGRYAMFVGSDDLYAIAEAVQVEFVVDAAATTNVIAKGTAVAKPEDPVKEGYTFKGWKAAGATEYYDFATLVTADLVLTAEFEQAVTPKTDPDTPIAPAEGKTAQETADAINAAGVEKVLNVPTGITTEAGKAAYCAMFAAKPTADGKAVQIELKPAVETEIKEELADETTSSTMLAPDADGKATITAKPGLFYGIKAVGNLAEMADREGENWVQATGDSVKVVRPTVSGSSAFFQATCSAKNPEADK